MQNYKYNPILKNKKYFECLLDKLNSNSLDFKEKLDIALYALKFAVFRPTGYFYSNILEKFFIDIGKNNDIKDYNIHYKEKTILHVMTQSYIFGGHSRVVERWIENQKNFNHSVILLHQGRFEISELLKNNCKKSGGELIISKENDIIKNALNLRKISLNYEYIILHTHMEDPTATIAFGTEKFKRPVILFNHADHLFWIGKYIADIVIDFRIIASITKKFRLINNCMKLSIPTDERKQDYIITNNKTSNIIFTSGSDFKFTPIGDKNIVTIYDKILKQNSKAKLYVIGIENSNNSFEILKKRYAKRINLFKSMPYKDYIKILKRSSVVIDTYPFSGGTALIDAISNNLPFVSLKTYCGQTDFVEKSDGICRNEKELVNKVLKILNNEEYAYKLKSNELIHLKKETDIKLWNQSLNNILKKIPKYHRIQKITEQKYFINNYSFMNYMLYKNQGEKIYKKFHIFFILTFEKYKNIYGSLYTIKFLNTTILKFRNY